VSCLDDRRRFANLVGRCGWTRYRCYAPGWVLQATFAPETPSFVTEPLGRRVHAPISTPSWRNAATKGLAHFAFHQPDEANQFRFADLYRYGTGWLGWPPSEVWNASPAELEAAVLAHFDRLVMMTPGADAPEGDKDAQRQANIAAGLDPEFDREGLHALKARHSA